MPYDPRMVQPMRDELTSIGVTELTSAADVDRVLGAKSGTVFLMVNSVCGCAAGQARPAVRQLMQLGVKPEQVVTVFAGQDTEATARARSYFADVPPSSPSMAFFKDGELVHFVPRHKIENRDAGSIARELAEVFDRHCAKVAV